MLSPEQDDGDEEPDKELKHPPQNLHLDELEFEIELLAAGNTRESLLEWPHVHWFVALHKWRQFAMGSRLAAQVATYHEHSLHSLLRVKFSAEQQQTLPPASTIGELFPWSRRPYRVKVGTKQMSLFDVALAKAKAKEGK